mgnify:CR=1 FL=1
MARQKQIWLASLASRSGLRSWYCPELWCRSQTWPASGVAVAAWRLQLQFSPSTPSLGTSICRGCRPQNQIQRYPSIQLERKALLSWIRTSQLTRYYTSPLVSPFRSHPVHNRHINSTQVVLKYQHHLWTHWRHTYSALLWTNWISTCGGEACVLTSLQLTDAAAG